MALERRLKKSRGEMGEKAGSRQIGGMYSKYSTCQKFRMWSRHNKNEVTGMLEEVAEAALCIKRQCAREPTCIRYG